MPSAVLFAISVTFGMAVWGAAAWNYIWPRLRELPSPENLRPILLLHGFRFLGLAFLVPGVTWVFNIFGTADLLFAFYLGGRISLPDTQGLLGAGYFVLMAYVPLLLITHVLA